MPSLFPLRGAPPLVDDATWVADLVRWVGDGFWMGLAKLSIQLV
jgi:hypothetical protein